LAFVFESILDGVAGFPACRVLLCDADFASIIRDDLRGAQARKTMAQRCAICGKGPQFGHHVSHSKVHTKRRFMPNLHKARVTIDGRSQTALVCTRCLRTQAKSA
jgi:large subunit ribosomal protein L28